MKDDTTQTEQTPPANEGRSGQRDTPYMVVLSGVRAGEMIRLSKPATLLGRSEMRTYGWPTTVYPGATPC